MLSSLITCNEVLININDSQMHIYENDNVHFSQFPSVLSLRVVVSETEQDDEIHTRFCLAAALGGLAYASTRD